jgi:hypothetical protein
MAECMEADTHTSLINTPNVMRWHPSATNQLNRVASVLVGLCLRDDLEHLLTECAHCRHAYECPFREVLLVMLLMKAAFGIPGLIAAPICCAYLKSEPKAGKLL